jgi:AraC-like DNA-binding protein
VVEDKVFPFEPDDIVIINNLEMHRACMPEGNTSSWHFIMTDPARLLAGSVAREPGIADTRILSGSAFPNRFPHRQYPRILTRDYGEPLSVTDLARSCYIGTGHLRRLFQAAFHKSPQDYLNDYRVNMAGNHLSTTDRSVADIALACGFPTLSSFNRQFRKRKQCAPREWRGRFGPG